MVQTSNPTRDLQPMHSMTTSSVLLQAIFRLTFNIILNKGDNFVNLIHHTCAVTIITISITKLKLNSHSDGDRVINLESKYRPNLSRRHTDSDTHTDIYTYTYSYNYSHTYTNSNSNTCSCTDTHTHTHSHSHCQCHAHSDSDSENLKLN